MDTNEISNKLYLPAAVVLAGLFIAGAVFWNGSHPSAGTPAPGTGAAPAVNIKDVTVAGEPFIGNPNAPVTLAEWSDYQCPFCKQFEVTTLPQIIQDYVNAGKVKVVFKDFNFLGPNSMVDAEYARAVWALYPDKFLDWRTAFYNDQPQENSLDASANLAWLLKTTGSVSGIDVNSVKAAVAANKSAYDAAINADRTEGQKFGINATPSFIIGTQLIQGAYPYANFKAAIDAALAK